MKGKKTIKKGDRVLISEGEGTVIEITGRAFPYFVKLDSGSTTWKNRAQIISIGQIKFDDTER